MKKQKANSATPRPLNTNRDLRAVTQPRTTATGFDPLESLESALGRAARIAEPYPEEAEAIENVIRFVRGHRAGQPRAGQPRAGQPHAGQPHAGQLRAGQPHAGQPHASQPRAGQLSTSRPPDVRRTDVLLALSILISALDRDPTPEERQMFEFLDALFGVPSRAVPTVPAVTATVPPYAASAAPRPPASRYDAMFTFSPLTT